MSIVLSILLFRIDANALPDKRKSAGKRMARRRKHR
jgi:hypothetical protein